MLIEEIKPDDSDKVESEFKEVSATIEEMDSSNDELASVIDEVTAAEHDESVPSIQDVASAINKFIPKVEPIALKLNDVAPQIYKFAHKLDEPKVELESVSKIEELVSETAEAVPKVEQTRPKLGQINLKIVECSQESESMEEETTTGYDDCAPKIEEIFTKSENPSPKIEEIPSEIEDIPSKVDEIPPKIEEITTKNEDITTKSEDTAPKIEDTDPKIEEAPPKVTKPNPLMKQARIEENSVRDITINDSNEMESMLWFDEDVSQQNYDSIDYQLPQLSDCITETFSEDETCQHSGDFTKVLELCHEQKKDAMQLCFINENDKLMQLYDEAVDRKLVNESDVHQLKEIEALCREEVEKDEGLEVFPNLDGILTVTRLDLQEQSSVDDDNDVEVLQFSHIEISEVKKNAENLIDGVIKSLEDINMPL
jgi:uncharacterized coiled-coil DUF342 family protein